MKSTRTIPTFTLALASAVMLVAMACASAPEKAPAAPAPAPAAPATEAPAASAPATQESPKLPESASQSSVAGLGLSPAVEKALQSSTEPGTVFNPAGNDPMAAPWSGYNPQPPDGVWLVDLEGYEYFVVPMEKQEGFYTRTGPNTIRLKHGIPLSIEREDETTFYVRVYKPAPADATGPQNLIKSQGAKLSDEEKAAIAKAYEVRTTESAALSFVAIGAGLPTRGQWRNGFAVVDVDGDGALDIVHGAPRRTINGTPVIFRGDGKGGFQQWTEAKFPPYPYDYGDAAAGDFNGDGKIDLAFGIHLRGIVAMLGDGKGNFTPFSEGLELNDPAKGSWSANPFTTRALEVVDWNRDGLDDILALSEGPSRRGQGGASAYAAGKRIYLAGKTKWTQAQGSLAADESIGDAIALGDFNADRRIDFITSMSQPGNKGILNRAGNGTTWEVSNVESLRPDAIIRGVAAADVNGDRRADMFVSWQNREGETARTGIDLIMSQPGGWVRVALWGATGRDGVRGLGVGDLDGDGKHDVVGFTDKARPVVLKGLGKGGFTLERAEGIELKVDNCSAYTVTLADVDRDGRDEIVAGFAGEQCDGQGSFRAWKAQPGQIQ